MNKLLNLPHILWINMDESKDRYNHMTNLFEQYPVKNTRIEAINYNTITKSYSSKPKQFAVHLSHLKALQYFLDNFDYNHIIITEDDLSFDYVKYWNYTFNNYIDMVPDDWEIIKLFAHYNNYVPERIDIVNINDRISYGAGCYMIKREAAIKILDFYKCDYNILTENEIIIDRYIFKLCNTYTIPLMTFRENNDTTILGDIFLQKCNKVKNKITNVWKKNLLINRYTIFGERNSGTNYLQKILEHTLKIPFTKRFGFKHWYIKDFQPRGEPNTTTDNECIEPLTNGDKTLFIFIVRNPYDWVCSMKSKPYHIKNTNHKNLYEFISNKYIAYEQNRPGDHGINSVSPWYPDNEGKYFMERADNLIDLRNKKNEHFYNLRNHVNYFYLIRQENLIDDINKMIDIFGLEKKKDLQLFNYRQPKKYNIDNNSFQFIKDNLNNYIDNTFYKNELYTKSSNSKIIKAKYGANNIYIDVISIILNCINENKPFKICNKLFKMDPVPNVVKHLIIEYDDNTVVKYMENDIYN